MLAEVRLLIAPREVRLILKAGDEVIEDDLWKPDRKITQKEARQLAEVAFHDYYDLVNNSINNDGE